MSLLIDVFELALDHMGVDLGGGNVRVTQHLLDGPQVRSVFQQVDSKGMAQGVGRDVLSMPAFSW